MTQDDDFEPRLGKIRSRGSKRGQRYLHQVLRAVALAGGTRRSDGSRRRATFNGSRIGRGAGVGRVLASRDRYAAYRQRRVIIKSRIVKLAGNGMKGAQAHLRYIQRDGVTRDGQPGELYSADQDQADGKAFLEGSDGDRHQFRFTVSAEDGVEYDDLKPFIHRLMQQMEEDLGTKLDWMAVDHYNTGHPHSHVIVPTEGMRERAAEIVRLDLGPRSDYEIEDRLRDEVNQERFTSIDRNLLREQDGEGLVWATDEDAFRQSLRAGRLQKLKRLGLADEAAPGQWRLARELEPTPRRMGERGHIIKAMHRDLAEKGIIAPDHVRHISHMRSIKKSSSRKARKCPILRAILAFATETSLGGCGFARTGSAPEHERLSRDPRLWLRHRPPCERTVQERLITASDLSRLGCQRYYRRAGQGPSGTTERQSYGSTMRRRSPCPAGGREFRWFICTCVLDLLLDNDIRAVVGEAHRALAPEGLLGIASLTKGYTREFSARYRRHARTYTRYRRGSSAAAARSSSSAS